MARLGQPCSRPCRFFALVALTAIVGVGCRGRSCAIIVPRTAGEDMFWFSIVFSFVTDIFRLTTPKLYPNIAAVAFVRCSRDPCFVDFLLVYRNGFVPARSSRISALPPIRAAAIAAHACRRSAADQPPAAAPRERRCPRLFPVVIGPPAHPTAIIVVSPNAAIHIELFGFILPPPLIAAWLRMAGV